MGNKNDWEILSKEKILTTPVFDIYREKAVCPRNGKDWNFYHIKCPADWVNVVAVTKQKELVCIRQFRFGTKENELEIPGGLIEPNELPLNAGIRELKEETGYTGGRASVIGRVSPNPALQGNFCYTVFVEDVEKTSELELDHAEDIETVLLPIDSLEEKITKNEIRHGLVLNALYFYEIEMRKRRK